MGSSSTISTFPVIRSPRIYDNSWDCPAPDIKRWDDVV
jgi:hypothetical protein